MSTLKVSGTVEEKIRAALGGANPTAGRLVALLEELDTYRAVVGDQKELVAEHPEPKAPEGPDEVDEDDDDEDDEEEVVSDPLPAPAVVPPDSPSDSDPSMKEMMALVLGLLKRQDELIQELRRPAPTAKEIDQAIGDGQLPAPMPAKFDISSLPRGVWFDSPDWVMPGRQRVKMRLCGCQACRPRNPGDRPPQQHYYCVICRRGPLSYSPQGPFYVKAHMLPGGTDGIRHDLCSAMCQQQYMPLLGVVAGVNEFEPPQPTEGIDPTAPGTAVAVQRPVMAMSSD